MENEECEKNTGKEIVVSERDKNNKKDEKGQRKREEIIQYKEKRKNMIKNE